MTDVVQQPSLDLGDYRGKNILQTSIRLLNANAGIQPTTDLEEPRIFELEEELTIAIRVKVIRHAPQLIEKGEDEGALELIQSFKCGTIAVIPDSGATKKALDAVESRREAAEKAAAKAKEAAKPKRTARGKGTVVPISDSLQQASDKGGFSV
jgi:hypothetical protein